MSVCAALVGCCDQKTLDARDIAENHIAVLSVTRWDDFKTALQPQFNLTADQALTNSLPDTLQLQQSIAHQFNGSFSLQLAPSSAFPAGFGAGQSGAATTQPSSSSAQPTTQPTTQPFGASPLGTDPFLQYQAATALYEEVQLLNRYITDAAIPGGDRAYVVRLQISTMPRRRDEAYDIYMDLGLFMDHLEMATEGGLKPNMAAFRHQNLSFLSHKPSTAAATKQSAHPEDNISEEIEEALKKYENNQVATSAVSDLLDKLCELESQAAKSRTDKSKAIQHLIQLAIAALRSAPKKPHDFTPKIIPLLVNDEIESALAARQAQDLEQLAFALSAAYAGIGGKVNLQNIDQAMRNAVGRDYNSLLSVARVNDNTLRVRIGARQTSAMKGNAKKAADSAESYQLITQTHNVSLLVLLPMDEVKTCARTIYFGTQADFVPIDTNSKTVPARTQPKNTVLKYLMKNYKEEFCDLFDPPSKMDEQCISQKLYRAAASAQNGSYNGYLAAIGDSDKLDIGRANALWLRLSTDRTHSPSTPATLKSPPIPIPLRLWTKRFSCVTMATRQRARWLAISERPKFVS
jgi:hypothetical protein